MSEIFKPYNQITTFRPTKTEISPEHFESSLFLELIKLSGGIKRLESNAKPPTIMLVPFEEVHLGAGLLKEEKLALSNKYLPEFKKSNL